MKNVLIVVDYQNDFVDGALGFPGAELLEPCIASRIEACLAQGDDLVFTFDTHETNYLETHEGTKLPVAHCIEGTPGWALYGSISKYLPQATRVFEKPTFGSLELASFLRSQSYEVVELVGLVSNICVLSNAVLAKAALPEAQIIVDATCTASHDPAMNAKALDVLEGIHITVVNR